MDLKEYHRLGRELFDRLHLPTYPVAITYVRSEEEIPGEAMRPSAHGRKLSICQAFTYARAWGAHVAITHEDNFCVPSSAMHKWVEVSDEEFIESQVKQGWHKNREAEGRRKNFYNNAFKASGNETMQEKPEEYIGLVCSPLHSAIMEPHTILVYGNGIHITHIIHALCYDYTYPLMSSFEGFGESCAKGGLAPFITGRAQVVIPGMGDRAFAGISADEIGVGLPAGQLAAVMENLFKTGGGMNAGMPFKTLMPTNLQESITPGFAYLKKVVDEKRGKQAGE